MKLPIDLATPVPAPIKVRSACCIGQSAAHICCQPHSIPQTYHSKCALQIKLPSSFKDAAFSNFTGTFLAPAEASSSPKTADHPQHPVAASGASPANSQPSGSPLPKNRRRQLELPPPGCALAGAGSFPCRRHLYAGLWHDLVACRTAASAAPPTHDLQQQLTEVAREADDADARPFEWVPCDSHAQVAAGASDMRSPPRMRVRPRSAQLRSHSTVSLPLELFDSPDMDQAHPQALLAAAAERHAAQAGHSSGESVSGAPAGVAALSRFFEPNGTFTWAPCTLLEYDGYVC